MQALVDYSDSDEESEEEEEQKSSSNQGDGSHQERMETDRADAAPPRKPAIRLPSAEEALSGGGPYSVVVGAGAGKRPFSYSQTGAASGGARGGRGGSSSLVFGEKRSKTGPATSRTTRSPIGGGGGAPAANALLPPQLSGRKNVPTEDLSNHFKDSTRRKYNSGLAKKSESPGQARE